MIRAVILGQGMVAAHLVVGVERIKAEELKPYGVPLAGYQLPYEIKDIEFLASYDVDPAKVGKNLHELCREMLNGLPVPETLKKLEVREGIHLGSLIGLVENPLGLERELSLRDAIDNLVDEWIKM
ncbi:myo-inositol-1-phosphate synthase, partial [archaeon]